MKIGASPRTLAAGSRTHMVRTRLPLVLAALQAGDVIVTQTSNRYGPAHLDHLGVPTYLRPALPYIKVGAILALVASRNHPRSRVLVGRGLVSYYSAAATFHVLSHDRVSDVLPAATCALLAAAI